MSSNFMTAIRSIFHSVELFWSKTYKTNWNIVSICCQWKKARTMMSSYCFLSSKSSIVLHIIIAPLCFEKWGYTGIALSVILLFSLIVKIYVGLATRHQFFKHSYAT